MRSTQVNGKPFSVIQTDFGELLVPQSEITGAVPAAKAGDTFLATEVRVVRRAGSVERRAAGAREWVPLDLPDPGSTGQPRSPILPGDTVRTGADGQLDVMLHQDAWVRLEASTEVEFSTSEAKGSLSLLRGTTVQEISGRPRGQTFRVTTPSTTLGVRGTRFTVFVEPGTQGVAVLEGMVRVGAATDVAAGQEGTWTDPTTVTVSPLTEARRRPLEAPAHRQPRDDMALVPGGTYLIGAGVVELTKRTGGSGGWTLAGCGARKSPGPPFSFAYGRPVQVTSFLIDRREVSGIDFARFEAAESGTPPPRAETRDARGGGPALVRHGRAEAFSRWMGKSLPKATQWHVAARGGDGRVFPWGDARRPEHCALAIGSWETPVAPWTPPPDLPPVDAPTVDISPFGVCAMVSSAPEWVRSRIDREPIWAVLSEGFHEYFTGGWGGTKTRRPPTLTCGDAGSLFHIGCFYPRVAVAGVAEEGPETVGFRGVVELDAR